MDEQAIRDDERAKVARSMVKVGNNLLRDEKSDAVDGYVAAVLIDMAKTIEQGGDLRSRSRNAELMFE